ncbi:hypothetical protein [Actinocrispum wychmicini]|uniref:Uncharacterized protein n=1 Tax=Actinocrispum wychmicini TaxID=1213861 RepID=A0A4R2JH20_9PSEU|nr:hypothetical protein [Actinocrispum wychmicini]TCO57957.1 hypothetical protein EV192_10519 [Actinocrispum wychmicini]
MKIDLLGTELEVPNPTVISVPIEIKGAWHKDLLTAQDIQLAQRYLEDLHTTDGIYLVAWFTLEHWNILATNDRRKTKATKHKSATRLLHILRTQAAGIQSVAGRLVITVPRSTTPDDRITKTVKRHTG